MDTTDAARLLLFAGAASMLLMQGPVGGLVTR